MGSQTMWLQSNKMQFIEKSNQACNKVVILIMAGHFLEF